jgi:hypothetical protein
MRGTDSRFAETVFTTCDIHPLARDTFPVESAKRGHVDDFTHLIGG